ncbi:hypothetical protein BKA80DRAFT_281716 [Phyllosticta citrichinensis]
MRSIRARTGRSREASLSRTFVAKRRQTTCKCAAFVSQPTYDFVFQRFSSGSSLHHRTPLSSEHKCRQSSTTAAGAPDASTETQGQQTMLRLSGFKSNIQVQERRATSPRKASSSARTSRRVRHRQRTLPRGPGRTTPTFRARIPRHATPHRLRSTAFQSQEKRCTRSKRQQD